MKVLVTGVKGQLGYDVVRELQKRGHEAVGVDIDEMDITDAAAVERVMTRSAAGCSHSLQCLYRRRPRRRRHRNLSQSQCGRHREYC